MSTGFKPSRGKVAIKHIGNDCESENGGIIFTQEEHPTIGKAQVLSIGYPEVLNNGKPIKLSFAEGDYILYNKEQGWSDFSGIRLIKSSQVIAVIDKDTVIG